jgi:hypothetical protein
MNGKLVTIGDRQYVHRPLTDRTQEGMKAE